MKLKNLLTVDSVSDARFASLELNGISADSRTVKPGDLFVAMAGAKDDGLRFVGQALAAGAADDRGHAAGQAAHMMGMDDVRTRLHLDQSPNETWRKRIRWVAADPAHGTQRTHSQTTGLAFNARVTAKGQQFAVDGAGQGARELERVALAAAE